MNELEVLAAIVGDITHDGTTITKLEILMHALALATMADNPIIAEKFASLADEIAEDLTEFEVRRAEKEARSLVREVEGF